MTLQRAIGLMSGTSMDGVDVAYLETDGDKVVRQGATSFRPYGTDDRVLLRVALAEAASLSDRAARPPTIAACEDMVTARHAEAVERFLYAQNMSAQDVDVIGFHGQTVIHRPKQRLTVQIGDGQGLADRLGIPVVHDFRAADVAAGGEGAPVVPVYHRALIESAAVEGPVAFLNIGGVANVTYVNDGSEPVACDTGPGNALLDDLMLSRIGVAMDRDGRSANFGRVDEAILAELLKHPYFDAPPPKSLDRNAFSGAAVDALGLEDAAATLTAFTAASVARVMPLLPEMPRELIVCGGGARNPVLLRELAARVTAEVRTAADYGWSVDSMEAQAFAYLAVRSLRGLPLTFPGTTGAPRALTGGKLASPSGQRRPAVA
jgi:anhydro-N-acetylmuramic acid kinase